MSLKDELEFELKTANRDASFELVSNDQMIIYNEKEIVLKLFLTFSGYSLRKPNGELVGNFSFNEEGRRGLFKTIINYMQSNFDKLIILLTAMQRIKEPTEKVIYNFFEELNKLNRLNDLGQDIYHNLKYIISAENKNRDKNIKILFTVRFYIAIKSLSEYNKISKLGYGNEFTISLSDNSI